MDLTVLLIILILIVCLLLTIKVLSNVVRRSNQVYDEEANRRLKELGDNNNG